MRNIQTVIHIYKERITYSSVARVAADKNHVVSVIVFGKGQGSDCDRRKGGAAPASCECCITRSHFSVLKFLHICLCGRNSN